MELRVLIMVRLRQVMVLFSRVMLLLLLNDGDVMIGILMQCLVVANRAVVSRCHNGCVVDWSDLMVRNCGGVMRGNVVSHSGSVMCDGVVRSNLVGDSGVVHWGHCVVEGSLVMERSLVMDWGHGMVHRGDVVRSHMVCERGLVMSNWLVMHRCFMMCSSCMMDRSLVMDRCHCVMHWRGCMVLRSNRNVVHWGLMLRQGLVVSVSGTVVNRCFVMHCSCMVNWRFMSRLMNCSSMVHWSCMMGNRSDDWLMVLRDSHSVMSGSCLMVRSGSVV